MLLGQIVAISFATNLLFLTLILSPPQAASSSSSSKGASQQKWVGLWLLNLLAIFATAYPALLLSDERYWHHSPAFMPVLLAPHVALLVVPLARAVLAAKYSENDDPAFTDKVYSYMWVLSLINGGLMLLKTSAAAYAYNRFDGVQHALLEHPAVSSVSFDVIFCWISWACWNLTQRQTVEQNPKKTS